MRVLTPTGTGAIAVIRISGRDAWALCSNFLKAGKGQCPDPPKPGALLLLEWVDDIGPVDEVIVSGAPGVEGELRVDVCTHGSVRVVQRVVLGLQSLGARLVDDEVGGSAWLPEGLIQAEADQLLARAVTPRSARFLAVQRQQLPVELDRLAALEATNPVSSETAMAAMLNRARAGKALGEGLSVALIGPVNAGKSTLANRLVGSDASMISPEAGTTRDWVSTGAAIHGVPVRVIDTPGWRGFAGTLEMTAIQRAESVMRSADLLLVIVDRSAHWPTDFFQAVEGWSLSQPMILVINKTDLAPCWIFPSNMPWTISTVVEISALEGKGLPELETALLQGAGLGCFNDRQPTPFTARQTQCMLDYLGTSEAVRPKFSDWLAEVMNPRTMEIGTRRVL